MEATIIFKDKDNLKIKWECPRKGFGELIMKWNPTMGDYSLDAEFTGIDTVIEIFKALK